MGDSGRSPAALASVSPYGRQEQPWLGDAKNELGAGGLQGGKRGDPDSPEHPRGCGIQGGGPRARAGKGGGRKKQPGGGDWRAGCGSAAVPTPLKVSSRWRTDYPLT